MEKIEIHTRLNEQGHFCYRIWNVLCKSYMTNVLSKKELQLYFLIRTFNRAISDLLPSNHSIGEELLDWINEDAIKKSEKAMLASSEDKQRAWEKDNESYTEISFHAEWVNDQTRKILIHVSDNLEKKFFD